LARADLGRQVSDDGTTRAEIYLAVAVVGVILTFLLLRPS
jgi:hypothetical protein